MKVHLLQQAISGFLTRELGLDDGRWCYTHNLIRTFEDNWVSPNEETIDEIYNDCLRSDYTQRWWKKEQYRPKEIMQLMIEADPALATIAWNDLFNEDAGLEGRLGRFDFYCEDLLKMVRQKNFRSVETYHHQDANIVSLYLAGRFPEQYTLYPGLDCFRSFCILMGSPDIPAVEDLNRYMKVAKVVYTFLQRDAQFVKLIAQRSGPKHKVAMIPFQVSYEFIAYEGERVKKKGSGL